MSESRLIGLAQRSHRLQDWFIKLAARWHPQFVHSAQKMRAMKMAFHFVNYEGVDGDYVEFGVFEGASFITAYECHTATNGPLGMRRRFFGFDSFEGLRFDEGEASHARLEPGRFATDRPTVEARVRRVLGDRVEWALVAGFIDETLTAEAVANRGIDRIAVAMFDLDLGEPTKLALDFVVPRLQPGSVLMFDEFFMFKGDPTLGEAGALATFQASHPAFQLRHYMDYGAGGRVFIAPGA